MPNPSYWYAEGGIASFDPVSGVLKANQTKLATNAAVDVGAVSRVGVLGGPIGAQAPIRISYDDIFIAQTGDPFPNPNPPNRDVTAYLFVVPANLLAEGVRPDPFTLWFGSLLPGGMFFRSDTWASDRPWSGPDAPNSYKNIVFNFGGPWSHQLQPGTKYWFGILPMADRKGSTSGTQWALLDSYSASQGRSVSLWTNRTPDAPIITSPQPNRYVDSGDDITLSYTSRDPDAFFGGTTPAYTDRAGVQVQYAPLPSAEEPNPAWVDMPFANTSGILRKGWWLDKNIANSATEGIQALWANASVQVRVGSITPVASRGMLPAGSWQIRLRTFDYGHPNPNVWAPALNNKLTPANYPAVNTSPWSEPVPIHVSSQVPPPIPLSPINSAAIVAGTSVPLVWQYRNTASFEQGRRTVQIRKVGEDWTTLVSNQQSPNKTLTLSSVPVSPGLLSDPGFEDGTLGGWSVSALSGTPSPALVNVSGNTHSGERALQIDTSGAGDVRLQQVVALDPADEGGAFTFETWGWRSNVNSGPSEGYIARVEWLDAANAVLSSSDALRWPWYAGWQRAAEPVPLVSDFPPGATHARLQIDVFGTPNGVLFDDVNFQKGSGSSAVHYELVPGTEYEWRVQVTDTDGFVSNWSEIARFWAVPSPSSGAGKPVPSDTIEGATLGCGTHRVFVYRRGGKVRVGELTGLSHVDWARLRDDLSTAKVVVSNWGVDCGELLAKLSTWAYELVIYRDNGYSNDRVWEGPITLLTYEQNSVTISARDVMAYAYRRILKQRMSDPPSTGGDYVTSRAARVLQNVFAPDDPNILQYLTVMTTANDAVQYRTTPAYSRTAFEEIDDMASNAGLDYTVTGRTILLWSTKNRIGVLPEFRDADLGSSPIVSEYGMSFANRYALTDGNGVYGEATRLDENGEDEIYGLVEILSSSWASDSSDTEVIHTAESAEKLRQSFAGMAERAIASRNPPPVVVRVPDNTSLNPDTVISIQHLVPGVAIPLRSVGTLREVRAMQKLDSVRVVEESGKETISITMSPFTRDDAELAEVE